MSAKLKIFAAIVACLVLVIGAGSFWLWQRCGAYGFNSLGHRGGTLWVTMAPDDQRLSSSMRLAFQQPLPDVQSGPLVWREVEPGYDVAELPVLHGTQEVDRILLSRIDPVHFRFAVRNAPAGDKDIDGWERALPQAVLIVNGSYYALKGTPDTPVISNGAALGPKTYNAKAGAFVAADGSADIKDLSAQDWSTAFKGADNAMVSYPLLIGDDGQAHVATQSRWLANRTFVGKDAQGQIIVGTTQEAFFSLARLATFLKASPLGLKTTLNLDGGPIACQSVRLKGFHRKFYARWEAQTQGDKVRLLTWPFAQAYWAMPMVLTVERR